MKTILFVILAVLIIGGALYFVQKPTQDAITPELLKEKDAKSDAYFNFIVDNLVGGGPGKDGIPSIDTPKYISAEDALLFGEDIVFGVNHKGLIAAYPKNILYWHEIVNEEIDGEKISITYCPLTESVIGYLGKELGVSGKLYNSNLVMYDRETDTKIPQILGIGIDGPAKGIALATFPITVTTWQEWKTKHPTTKVLSRDTGFSRDYDRNPYPGYDQALRVWFPVAAKSDKFNSKTIIHGVEYEKQTFALIKAMVKDKGSIIIPIESDKNLIASYDKTTNSISVIDESGKHVKSFDSYWFAWYAYHPDTKIIA